MRRFLIALAALSLATPSVHAQSATGFAIGGEPFAQAEIIDARALPGLDGAAEIMLTLDAKAAKRLETLTQAQLTKPLPVTLDGQTIASPTVAEPIAGGVLTIAGGFTLPEAEALAKRISGKDPVPEEFEE